MDKKSKNSTVEEFEKYHSEKSDNSARKQVKDKSQKKNVLQKIKDYLLQKDFVSEDDKTVTPIIKNRWHNIDRREFGYTPHDFYDPHFEEYYGWSTNKYEDKYEYYRYMQNKNNKDKNKEDEDVIEL